MRSLGILLVGACIACAPTGQDAPQTEQDEAEPQTRDDQNRSADLRLRWSFEPDDRWTETVTERMFLLEHPKGGADEERPVLTLRRVDQLEVLDASGPTAMLSITPVELEATVRDGERTIDVDHESPPEALTDGLAAQRLATVGVPLVATVDPLGAVTQVHDPRAHANAVKERFESLARALDPTAQQDARQALDTELADLGERVRGWGLRPRLSVDPVGFTTSWTHQVRVPSLMGSTVAYDVTHTVHRLTETMAVVTFYGKGTLETSPLLSQIVDEAELTVDGHYWMDRADGVLFEHVEELEMSVTFRPHPELGAGGTLRSRLERRRVSERRPDRPHHSRRHDPRRVHISLLTRSGRLPFLIWADSDLDAFDPVLDGPMVLGSRRDLDRLPVLGDPLGGL